MCPFNTVLHFLMCAGNLFYLIRHVKVIEWELDLLSVGELSELFGQILRCGSEIFAGLPHYNETQSHRHF